MFDFGLISGPLIGGLFGSVNAWLANKQKKQDQEHEVAMTRELRETRIAESQCEIQEIRENFDGKAFVESQASGNKTALSSTNLGLLLNGNSFMKILGSIIAVLLGFTDVARHIVRPGITIYLAIVCTNLLTQFTKELGGISIEKKIAIIDYGFKAQFQLLLVCVSWWFGDRTTSRLLNKG